MERLVILAVIFVLALAGALVADRERAGEPRTTTIADAGGAGAELASDPLISRCVTKASGDPGRLPRVEDLDQLVLAVSGQIVAIRELAFTEPVDAEFLSSKQIERRITALVAEETRPRAIRAEEDALQMLGAIEPDTDLEQLGEQALTSQVAGLYVPKTKELLVRADGELGAVELVTLAHELEHALADQALGIPLPDGRVPAGRSDAVLARQALVEGDATLAMTFYQLGALGPEAQLGLLLGPEGEAAQRDFARLPDFIQRQLLFPYTAGLRYACELYVEGGWAAIDRAYERPPGSSAEILFGRRAAEPGGRARLGDPGRAG